MKYIEKPCEAAQVLPATRDNLNTGPLMALLDAHPQQVSCYGYRNIGSHPRPNIVRCIILKDGAVAVTGDWLVLDASGKLYVQSDAKFKKCYKPVESEAFGGFRSPGSIFEEFKPITPEEVFGAPSSFVKEATFGTTPPPDLARNPDPKGVRQNIPGAVRDLNIKLLAFLRWPSDRNAELLREAMTAAESQLGL